MRFEIPGLTFGPTDDDLKRLENFQLVVKQTGTGDDEESQAAALGLSVEQWRRLRASLDALKKG